MLSKPPTPCLLTVYFCEWSWKFALFSVTPSFHHSRRSAGVRSSEGKATRCVARRCAMPCRSTSAFWTELRARLCFRSTWRAPTNRTTSREKTNKGQVELFHRTWHYIFSNVLCPVNFVLLLFGLWFPDACNSSVYPKKREFPAASFDNADKIFNAFA